MFRFEVKIPSKLLKNYTESDLLALLKLQKKVTENFTVLNEDNKITVCENDYEIIDKYIDVKKHYMSLRRDAELSNKLKSIEINTSKIAFIERIINEELIVNNQSKQYVIEQLDEVDDIKKFDSSYDYLLNMNIASLTSERINALQKDTKKLTSEYNKLKRTSINKLWLADIESFINKYNKSVKPQ